MRIAVFGAGAVGSYFGGKLAQAGRHIVFLARGQSLKALQRGPLRVSSIAGDFEVKVRATDDPDDVGHVDAVLLAVKAWQVNEAAFTLRPMMGENSVVVPLQNGVEAPAQIEAILGRAYVAGGLCKIIAFMAEPAHVKHVGAEPFVAFGELYGPSESPRLIMLRDEFKRAGVACEIPDDIRVAIWEKFIFIASISGVGAVTRRSIGEIRASADSRAQLEEAIREMVAVARAQQVALPADVIAKTVRYIESLPPAGTSSMQRDLLEGRPSELEAQNGAVVRLGRATGVKTPTHEAIYEELRPFEKRARTGLVT